MSRYRIIAVATALSILATAAPLAGVAWVSEHLAFQGESDELEAVAAEAASQAAAVFDNAEFALTELDQAPAPACGSQHIAFMRRLAMDVANIEEVGYFDSGLLKCSSWGVPEKAIAATSFDFRTPTGYYGTRSVVPGFSGGAPVVALHRGNYNVLINSQRILPKSGRIGTHLVLIDPDDRLVLGSDGLDTPPQSAGADQDSSITATGSFHGWRVVASLPRSTVLRRVDEERRWLFPIGILGSACLLALLIFLLRRTMQPASVLAEAIRRNELSVHYQPVIDLDSGCCCGSEALLRWYRADGSCIPPDKIMTTAGESGLGTQITTLVIKTVAKDMDKVLTAENGLHVSINIGARDLEGRGLVATLERALSGTTLTPGNVWLEITERDFVLLELARPMIVELRERGFTIAIDDFGTGYSSLSCLETLPVDIMKIDKSFVDALGTGSPRRTVAEHIIDMADSLGMTTVAEGIETSAQYQLLCTRNVDYGQGWLFGKAMPRTQFLEYLERSREPGSVDPLDAAHTPA